jgi:hypothetical protein
MSSCPRITITLPDSRGPGPWFDVKEPIPRRHFQFPEHIQLPQNAAEGLSLQDIRHAIYTRRGVKGSTSLLVARWYIASPREDTDAELCKFCRHINFDVLFHTQRKFPRSHTDNTYPIQSTRAASAGSSSRLTGLRKYPIVHQNLKAITGYGIGGFFVFTPYYDVFVSARYISYDPCGSLDTGFPSISWIAEDERKSHINRISPSFSPTVVDYGKIKSWVLACETEHHQESGTTIDDLTWFPEGENYTLPLIYVLEGRVGVVDAGTRYVELSYVWGGVEQLQLTTSNYVSLTTEGYLARQNLKTATSQTIHDAIEFIFRADQRYLWCDKLCIIQDAPDKQDQIKHMHKIYNNAARCLVAATSSRASDPLPRIVRHKHVAEKQYELVQGLKLTGVLPTLVDFLRTTTWDKCAWIYQDRVLSKRAVIIGDQQAYFMCNHGYVCSEQQLPVTKGRDHEATQGHISNVDGNDIFKEYADIVGVYLARHLPYNEDVLHAIAGVLSQLEGRFRSKFLFGLPETEIEQTLLWAQKVDYVRRLDVRGNPLFPSWSWAGWIGSVTFPTISNMSRFHWKNTDIKIHFTSGELRSPASQRKDPEWFRDDWEEVGAQ